MSKWKPFTAEDFALVPPYALGPISRRNAANANARLAPLMAALEALATAVEYDGDDEGLGQYTAISSVLDEYQKLVRE